jgi:hypothetical protein
MAAVGAFEAPESVRKDSALEKCAQLFFHEARTAACSSGTWVIVEALSVHNPQLRDRSSQQSDVAGHYFDDLPPAARRKRSLEKSYLWLLTGRLGGEPARRGGMFENSNIDRRRNSCKCV